MTTDLLGAELTDAERELADLYARLCAFVRRDDLAPSTRAGALAALAPLAVAMTDLGIVFEHLVDVGV